MLRVLFSLSIVYFFAAATPVPAQDTYFPPADDEAWETLSPEELSWNTEALDELLDWLGDHNTRSFVILKNGRIVVEQYYGINRETNWYWASAGKTVTATLVGALEKQGDVDIHSASGTWLGEGWTSLTEEQEQQITPWHQLTMTTGLDYEIDDLNCTLPQCLTFKAEPGTQWYYHNAPYTLLTNIIEEAAGQELNDFTEAVFDIIPGFSGFYADGASQFNRVFISNALDMARFGLFINNGAGWENSESVVTDTYFQDMISPSQDLNPAYGYLWWLNGQDSFIPPTFAFSVPGMLFPDAPADMYSALGLNSQILNIVPSEGLVVVRMGQEPAEGLFQFNRELWERLNEVREQATSSTPSTPAGFHLDQNYPNPFNPVTQISYRLSEPSPVRLSVYTLGGRHVETLVDETQFTGSYTVSFRADHLSSGIYIYRLHAGNQVRSKRMILLK